MSVHTNTRTLLDALWPLDVDDHETLILTTQEPGQRLQNHSYTSTDELAAAVSTEGRNVWLNLASRPAGTTARGGAGDCLRVPALWVDLDVTEDAEGVHKGAHQMATWSDADRIVAVMPLQPTFVVNTGHGYAVYYVFDEPMPAELAVPIIAALKQTVARISGGLADPSVYDVARMMRLPGTENVKRPEDPRECRIVEHNEAARYSATDLADCLDAPPPPPAPSRPTMATTDGTQARASDAYDATMSTPDTVALLVSHGCTEVDRTTNEGREVVRLARPGKPATDGHSLSVGWVAEGVTFVHSSGWPELPAGTYHPFRLYTALEHAGDRAAATAALQAQGLGKGLAELPELDGLSVARAFVDWLDDGALYVHGIGWHIWDGKKYVADLEEGQIMGLAMDYSELVQARAQDDLTAAVKTGSEEKVALAKKRLARASGYAERAKRAAFIADAAALLGTPADELDTGAEKLNTPDGILDLLTLELAPHDPAQKMTKITAARYTPGACTADWGKVLDGIPADLAEYLQVGCGMAAIGRSGGDVIFVAVGVGGGGMTTMLGAISNTLGGYGLTVDPKLFTQDGGNETQIKMPLRGARMALAAETGEDHYLNMERLKALAGGDKLQDRHLYSRTFAEWTPTHNLFLMTNHRPRIKSTDLGTWRRLKLLPFQEARLGGDNTDITLKARLLDQPDNRAAILAWVAEGAQKWLQAHKLPDSITVDAATAKWRDEEDVVASFFDAAGITATGERGDVIYTGALYEMYRQHCFENGAQAKAANNFKADVERHAERLRITGQDSFSYHRNAAGRGWYGLARGLHDEPGHDEPDTEAMKAMEFPW